MPNLNTCTFMGHLGRDPELRQSANGTAICNATMAVNVYDGKDAAGKAKERPVWVRVRVIGRQAEWVAKGRKGDVLLVANAEYLVDEVPDEKAEVGVKRYHYFLCGMRGTAAVFPKAGATAAQATEQPKASKASEDDGLPF